MSAPTARLRTVLGVVLVSLAVAACVGYFYFQNKDDSKTEITEREVKPDSPVPDPRLTYDTPFRNVKPHVKYVGDAACAVCHADVCKSYHTHPMGRSAELVRAEEPIPGQTKVASGPFDLEVKKTIDKIVHDIRLRQSDATPAVLAPAIAIGSGTRGKSYLTVENGCVWQSPVSWFGPDNKWDISPGFRIGRTLRRPISLACLYCHVNDVEPVVDTNNRYREPMFTGQISIGCERCHGPGELHVNERGMQMNVGGPDYSIVNPKHLSPALQRAVCEQCHSQGAERVERRGRKMFEFRPGLPFELFVSVYVRHPDIALANKSVGQFEQMEQSQCFLKSNGRMTCTSCHDPHGTPANKIEFYRSKCQSCHETPGSKLCSTPEPLRLEKRNDCVVCHMPKAASSNISHASVTNHRVVRMPASVPPQRPLAFGTVPLVRFRTGESLPPEELERDLGIALARSGRLVSPQEAAQRGDPKLMAIGRLKKSLAKWPGDAEAWEALADAYGERIDNAEKIKAAKNAIALRPNSESAIATLTAAATVANDLKLALESADRWVKTAPTSFDPRIARAFIHLKRGDWANCEVDCRAALALHPLHAEANLYFAICRERQGDSVGAQKALKLATDLEQDPREKTFLNDWFRRATR